MTDLLEQRVRTSRKRLRAVNSDGRVAPPYLSYEQFLDWADEDTLAEWVDGRVEMTSPASNKHQIISGVLDNILWQYVEFKDLGIVRTGPFQMKNRNGREPDLLFLAKEHLDRLKEVFLDGPADLVVEIVSPESRKRDRVTKLAEYQAAKIPEYWLINPLKNETAFYQLDANDQYQVQAFDSEGKYHSRVLDGFWLRPAWFWQPRLPSVQTVLLQIGGQDYLRYFLDQARNEGLTPPDA